MSDHEREQIEWVFGLTGGELADKPIAYSYTNDHGEEREGTFLYHYDGVPDYAGKSEFADLYSDDCEYFTAVAFSLWGYPSEEIQIGGKVFARVQEYLNSGETECPGKQSTDDGEDPCADEICPLCEREPGEEHGYIYIGDGWAEVVYRHDRTEHMRALASAHNIEIWNEHELDCADCGAHSPESHTFVHHDYCDKPTLAPTKSAKPAWWFWTCSPGCLPDSDLSGPYDDETDALRDATEGLE